MDGKKYMNKEKARDILRDLVSYAIDRSKRIEGTEEFQTEINDMEDFLIKEYFNK